MGSNERRSENLEGGVDGQDHSDSVTFVDVLFAVVMSLGLTQIMTRPWFKSISEVFTSDLVFEIPSHSAWVLNTALELVGVPPVLKKKTSSRGRARPSHLRSRHTDSRRLLAALGEIRELLPCIMGPVCHLSHVLLLGLVMVAETATRNQSGAMAEACGYNPVDGAFRDNCFHLPRVQPLWFCP